VISVKLRSDAGFTLVEVLVAGALLSVVLIVVAGIYTSITSAERVVNAITTTTKTAQGAATAIETGIRNSSEFILTNPQGSDQMVVARTADQDATLTWSCRAWYFSAANGGSIRSTRTTDGTHIPAPNASQLANWTLLVTGVSPRTGSGIFTVSGNELQISFNGTVSGQQPVAIQTTVAARTGVSEAHSCY